MAKATPFLFDKRTSVCVPRGTIMVIHYVNWRQKGAGNRWRCRLCGFYSEQIFAGALAAMARRLLGANRRSGKIAESRMAVGFAHRDDYDTVRVALHPKHKFRWSVVDAATERPLSATFTLQATNGEYAVEAATDSTCSIVGMLDDRMPYKLRVSAENYEPYEIDMERVMDDDFVVRLKPINIKTFVLHNMYFATAQTSILPSSELALDMLYNLLEQNPGLTIRIVGHTDDVGSESSNITLSQGRANSIKKAMVKLGIAPERIQTEGKGETDPVVANDSDQHRQMNRRVEIEILSGAEGINIQRYIQ